MLVLVARTQTMHFRFSLKACFRALTTNFVTCSLKGGVSLDMLYIHYDLFMMVNNLVAGKLYIL